jgi:hypothetical protein
MLHVAKRLEWQCVTRPAHTHSRVGVAVETIVVLNSKRTYHIRYESVRTMLVYHDSVDTNIDRKGLIRNT